MIVELIEFQNLEKVLEHAAHEISEMYDEWADDTINNFSEDDILEEGFDSFEDLAEQALKEVLDFSMEVFSKKLREKMLAVEEEEEQEFSGEISEEEEKHEEDIHEEDEEDEDEEYEE